MAELNLPGIVRQSERNDIVGLGVMKELYLILRANNVFRKQSFFRERKG